MIFIAKIRADLYLNKSCSSICAGEVILLTVEFFPLGFIGCAAFYLFACPPCGDTCAIVFPSGICKHVINKSIGVTINCIFVVSSALIIEVINVTVNCLPACLNFAINIIEYFLAVFTSIDTIRSNSERVSCSGNDSTPINYRTATIMGITLCSEIFNRTTSASNTEYTIFISAFCACRSFALCSTGSAYMEAPLALSVSVRVITIHFCLKYSFICRESNGCTINISNKTRFGTNHKSVISCTIGIPHSMRSKDIIPILHRGIVRNVIFTYTAIICPAIRHPDTNRKLSKESSIRYFGSCASKGNNRIIMAVDIIFRFKSISNFHAFQFPFIDIVKINGRSNGLDRRNIISNKIEPIYRACRQQSRGSRNFQTNTALLCIYSNLTNDITNVALNISDFNNDCMNTIVQVQVGNDNCTACGYRNVVCYQYAVNVNLCGITIQACSVGFFGVFVSLCFECDCINLDYLTGNFSIAQSFVRNVHVCEIRIFTVDCCIGIVNRDIVDEVCDVLIVVVATCTSCIVAVNLDIIKRSIVFKNFPAEIVPAAIFDSVSG